MQGKVFSNPNLPGLKSHERQKVYASLAEIAARIHKLRVPSALQELLWERNKFETTRDFWLWDVRIIKCYISVKCKLFRYNNTLSSKFGQYRISID